MRFLIAGGGTGGHLFPGIATAQALQRFNPKHEILFVGAATGIEVREVPKAGFNLKTIDVSGLKGRGWVKTLQALMQLPVAILKSIQILKKFDPDVVIGVGGYASGPVLLAAWLLRIQRVIGEQNAIPGFTNQILGRYFVKHVFGAFQKCGDYFPSERYVLTGNPLRASFSNPPPREPSEILILGGSLGARPLNQILPAAFGLVKASMPDLKIRHQTGQAECESVKERYQSLGLNAEVTPFIEDMPLAYSKAKLVIARAGAMACSEIAAMGVPSVLIPFPQAIDDHQTENANELVRAGAAILMPQDTMTPEKMGGLLTHLLLDLKTLENMAHKALQAGRPNAADRFAQKVIELC